MKMICTQALTGKMIILGYDKDGRPALYLRPSKQNTEENPKQLHFLVWALERCDDLMGPGVEYVDSTRDAGLVLIGSKELVSHGGLRRQGKEPVPPDFTHNSAHPPEPLYVLSSFPTHHLLTHSSDPERLGRSLIINVPWLVHAFLKMVFPFVDPRTRDKIRFNPDCVKEGLFEPDMLMREWAGAINFEYEHDKYWPAIVRMCDEHRRRRLEAWRGLGGTVGIREWDIKTKDVEAGVEGQEEEKEAVTVADRSEAVTLSDGVRGLDLKQIDETDVVVESEAQPVFIAV